MNQFNSIIQWGWKGDQDQTKRKMRVEVMRYKFTTGVEKGIKSKMKL